MFPDARTDKTDVRREISFPRFFIRFTSFFIFVVKKIWYMSILQHRRYSFLCCLKRPEKILMLACIFICLQ